MLISSVKKVLCPSVAMATYPTGTSVATVISPSLISSLRCEVTPRNCRQRLSLLRLCLRRLAAWSIPGDRFSVQLAWRDAEIEHFKLLLGKRRVQLGRQSEKPGTADARAAAPTGVPHSNLNWCTRPLRYGSLSMVM